MPRYAVCSKVVGAAQVVHLRVDCYSCSCKCSTGDSLWAPGHVSRILVCGMVRGSRVVPIVRLILGVLSKMNFHLLHNALMLCIAIAYAICPAFVPCTPSLFASINGLCHM